MQRVNVDLPKAISMVLEQIEKVGPDFTHKSDPNHPGTGGCYNVFADSDYSDEDEVVTTYHPGCLVGRVIIDSYDGDRDEISKAVYGSNAAQSDYYGLRDFLSGSGVLNFNATPAASNYLRHAQGYQDGGSTWGEAHGKALQDTLLHGLYKLTPEEAEFFKFRGKVMDLMEAFRLVSEVVKEKGENFTHQGDPARKDSFNGFGSTCVNVFYRLPDLDEEMDNPGEREYIAPGCLVGSAIHKAGWALKTFGEYGVEGGPADDLLLSVTNDGLYEEVTPMAKKYLAYVQQAQDNGANWGTARSHGLSKALKTAFYWPDHDLYGYMAIPMSQAEWEWLKVRPEWHKDYMGETYGSSI